MKDWKFLAKNLDQISNELIAKEDLLKLDIHISGLSYLEEGKHCFYKITEEYDKESNINDTKEEFTVFNSEEKTIENRSLCKEKRDVRTTSLAVACSSCYLPARWSFAPIFLSGRVPRLSALPFPSASDVCMSVLFALSASVVLMPRFSTLPSLSICLFLFRLSAPLSLFASGAYIHRSSILSASGVHVLELFAPSVSGMHMPESSALSASGVHMPGLSPPKLSPPKLSLSFSIWSSPQTPTSILKKQRLSQ